MPERAGSLSGGRDEGEGARMGPRKVAHARVVETPSFVLRCAAMSFRPRPDHPYAHAPRLPEGEEVPLASVLPGTGPFELEIGPGRGGFIWERAAAAPLTTSEATPKAAAR